MKKSHVIVPKWLDMPITHPNTCLPIANSTKDIIQVEDYEVVDTVIIEENSFRIKFLRIREGKVIDSKTVHKDPPSLDYLLTD